MFWNRYQHFLISSLCFIYFLYANCSEVICYICQCTGHTIFFRFMWRLYSRNYVFFLSCYPRRKPISFCQAQLWSAHSLNLMKVVWMKILMANNKIHLSRLFFLFLSTLLDFPFNCRKRFLNWGTKNVYIYIYFMVNC